MSGPATLNAGGSGPVGVAAVGNAFGGGGSVVGSAAIGSAGTLGPAAGSAVAGSASAAAAAGSAVAGSAASCGSAIVVGLAQQAVQASSAQGGRNPAGVTSGKPGSAAPATVAVPIRTSQHKLQYVPVLPHAGQVPTFSYHDPAFGCSFRVHQPSKDMLDHRLQSLQPDQKPPLQVLHEWEKWQEVEDHRRHIWEMGYHEMQPPAPCRPVELPSHVPATVCRTGSEEHQGFAWLLAGCP